MIHYTTKVSLHPKKSRIVVNFRALHILQLSLLCNLSGYLLPCHTQGDEDENLAPDSTEQGNFQFSAATEAPQEGFNF